MIGRPSPAFLTPLPVPDNGGQILKFLGEGFLATFVLALPDRGPLRRKVLVSSTFHDAAVADAGRMLSVGVYALRGIREPQELFAIADA